jgi:hypothetical protein
MSSGEQAATSFTKDGGTQARVITIWGSPFGCTSQAIAKLVRLLNDGIKRNYGHAGPRFVEFLLQNRKKWKKWRAMYEECVKAWEDEAGDNAIAGRLATPFAAISVAAILAHEAIDLPWEYDDPITPLWGELTREATDQAAAALQHVMGWANAHEAEFFGRRNDKLPPPTQGWAGRWDIFRASDDDIRWQWIGLFSHRLDEILHDGGFEPESTKRIWRDRGWLKVTKDRDGTIRTRCKVRIGEETPWLVLITKAAVKAAENKS